MTSLTRGMALIIAALGLVVGQVRAGVIYDQPVDPAGGGVASQNDTSGGNGSFATTYDNFTLGTSAQVTGISWVGLTFNPPDDNPAITAFTISFYSDSGGVPGSVLESETITGNANQTANGSLGGFPTFTYSASLSTALNASAGTEYWVSIVPDLSFPPQWGWSNGLGGDGQSYQVFFGSGSSLPGDRAFTLTGDAVSAVPEPSTLASAGIAGLFGLGFALRRRKAKAIA